MNEEILRKFYQQGCYGNGFYILVRSAGILVVEGPEEVKREGPPETLLRLFMSTADAIRYRERSSHRDDTRVMAITLPGLWALLPRIDSLSQKQFNAPLRVEVAYVPDDRVITVDTLHSIYELPS